MTAEVALFIYAALVTIYLTVALRGNEDVARENRALRSDLRVAQAKAERAQWIAEHPSTGRVVRGPFGGAS